MGRSRRVHVSSTIKGCSNAKNKGIFGILWIGILAAGVLPLCHSSMPLNGNSKLDSFYTDNDLNNQLEHNENASEILLHKKADGAMIPDGLEQEKNKTLLQLQLEEYYNEADIEFVNLDQNLVIGDPKNYTNFDNIPGDGISETIFEDSDVGEEDFDGNDNVSKGSYKNDSGLGIKYETRDRNEEFDGKVKRSNEEVGGGEEDGAVEDDDTLDLKKHAEKYYRDTFMDSIYQEINGKAAESAKENKRTVRDVGDRPKKRGHQITGDTVLHIRSEVSDVINSDMGNLVKGFKKSESYVDDIMIHPSEFLHEDLDEKDVSREAGEDGTQKVVLGAVKDKIDVQKKDIHTLGYTIKDIKESEEIKDGVGDKEEMIKDDFGVGLGSERWSQRFTGESEAKAVADGPQKTKKYPGKVLPNSSSKPVNVGGSYYRHSSKSDGDVDDDAELVSALDVKQLLECSLPADFRVTSWQKDGEDMSLLNDPRLQLARHALIARVAREHAGRWNCLGRDINGKVVTGRPIRLVVLEAPSPPYLEVFGRRLDPGNVFLPAKEGSDLELACRAEGGKPVPALLWGDEVPGLVTYAQRNDIDGAVTMAKLMVRRSHHNLTISCSASHPSLSGDLVASTRLHVQYAPRFGISRIPGFGFPLDEGSAVSLRCDVDSNPPAGARWQKDDGDPPEAQSADGFLNFTSVRREHSGWYKCTANHAFGNYSSIGYFLNVRYEVDATQEPDLQQTATGNKMEVALGGALQLQCPPGSSGCWGRPGSLLQKQAGELRCRGLAKEDAKKLEMLAAAVSQKGSTADGGPPVARALDPATSMAVNEGSPAELTAEFCADPSATRVVWLAAGRALQPGHTIGGLQAHYTENSTANSGCRIAMLSIGRASASEHAGEYSLVVRSPRGLAEAVFSLHVRPKIGDVWNIDGDEIGEGSNDTTSDTDRSCLISNLLKFLCLICSYILFSE